eukprot:g20268.t1
MTKDEEQDEVELLMIEEEEEEEDFEEDSPIDENGEPTSHHVRRDDEQEAEKDAAAPKKESNMEIENEVKTPNDPQPTGDDHAENGEKAEAPQSLANEADKEDDLEGQVDEATLNKLKESSKEFNRKIQEEAYNMKQEASGMNETVEEEVAQKKESTTAIETDEDQAKPMKLDEEEAKQKIEKQKKREQEDQEEFERLVQARAVQLMEQAQAKEREIEQERLHEKRQEELKKLEEEKLEEERKAMEQKQEDDKKRKSQKDEKLENKECPDKKIKLTKDGEELQERFAMAFVEMFQARRAGDMDRAAEKKALSDELLANFLGSMLEEERKKQRQEMYERQMKEDKEEEEKACNAFLAAKKKESAEKDQKWVPEASSSGTPRFLDELGHSRFGKAVKRWRTKHVSGPRLTSKKFTPPNWLLNGTWQWLVEHDGNIVLDLHKLKRFLRKRKRRSLDPRTAKGERRRFSTEVEDNSTSREFFSSMLTERVQYVASSKENVLKWKDVLQKMHVGKLTHGGRSAFPSSTPLALAFCAYLQKYAPPNYYETNVIFRNLKHKQAGKVRDAFEKTYLKCQDIQRDQFLLPFFLWQDRLTPNHSTEAIPMERLVEEVGYCMVDTRVFSIVGTQATLEEAQPSGTAPPQEECWDVMVVASLPGKDLDRLLNFFEEVKISAGETLMRHGDQVADDEPGLFVTKSGQLDVYVPEGNSEKKVFAYTESGQVVGELAVLFRAPRAATVKARTDAVLWSVDRRSFEACGGRSEGSMARTDIVSISGNRVAELEETSLRPIVESDKPVKTLKEWLADQHCYSRINQNPDALLASGAAAGVAAGFNAPIAGIFFASEVVRPGDDNSLDLTTRLLAAAVSAAVVQSFLPGGPAIKATDFSWDGGNVELLFFLLLGVLTGCLAYGYKKIVASSRDVITSFNEHGVPSIWLPMAR